MLVQGLQLDLEVAMTLLRADRLDRVAPGRGLAELVFELRDDRFQLADLAFDFSGLAVRVFSLGLLAALTGRGRRFRLLGRLS